MTTRELIVHKPFTLALVLLLAGCGEQPPEPGQFAPTPPNPDTGAVAPNGEGAEPAEPISAFLEAIASHCGKAYGGRITANEPPVENDPFEGQALVMHVRDCSSDELRIPFHVGDDHSRTWILTRIDDRLQLKHDHRHDDGSADVLSMYGGLSTEPGSAVEQRFPVDQESRELFAREGLNASLENTWAMQIQPGQFFRYELSRPSGRLFRVEFDLSRPVAEPPAAWGHDPAE